MRIAALAALATLVSTWVWPEEAYAEVRRCVLPTGEHIYTDRRCDALGALLRRPQTGTSTVGSSLYHGGCTHSLRDLTYQLATAIDSRDVNAMAGLYHWPGMSTSAATATMRRLNAIVHRPLVDIVPIFAAEAPPGNHQYPLTTSATRRPIGLRVQQTLANSATPSQTEFGLHRYMSCWWLRF